MLSSLVLAGCGGTEEPTVEPDASPSSVSRGTVLDEGFWRAEDLSEPLASTELELPSAAVEGDVASARLEVLSLDSDGDFARLVLAWLPPEEGPALGSKMLSSHVHRHESAPFVRLVDHGAGQVIEPLRAESRNFSYDAAPDIHTLDEDARTEPASQVSGEEGAEAPPGRDQCVCSLLASESGETAQPERTELIYVDFPAPESDEVDIFAGEWHGPLTGVPVSTDDPFTRPAASTWFFTHIIGTEDPPEIYGADARYAVLHPISVRSENLSGISTNVEGETQEVSIPSDVLFDFGSHELGESAEEVIEEAAEKINAEAQGQTVAIEGHTDDTGGEEVNQELSEQRAESVGAVLEDLLDDSISIDTVGLGMSSPLVPNTDAEGEPIPENQARNRRVSLRYVVFEETGVNITLEDAGVNDLQEAEEVDAAEGALASYLMRVPEGDTSESDVRLDVVAAERDEDLVTAYFALAAPDSGTYQSSVFTGHPRRDGPQHFGKNSQGDGDSPGLQNISLIDVESQQHFFPLRSGEYGCLCTEVAGTVSDLPAEASPMFAQFQLPDDLEGPVILRVPDAGQIELPEEFLDQLTGREG